VLAAFGSRSIDLARVGARAGVRASAVDEIRTIARSLADDAVPALRPFGLWKSRLQAPQLLPVGAGDAARAADDLRTLLRWTDDGHCFARGVVGARQMDRLLGGTATGPADAVHAAVAVVNTSMRTTGWEFHAATAFRSAEDGQVRVLDHLLGQRTGNASGIFGVDEWAGHLGRSAADVRIQSVLDNIPTAKHVTQPTTARIMRSLGGRLASSIERA
jgi:hypothetical protein